MQNRPLRSVLYVPASNAKALAKLASLTMDAVIVDLEDAVHPDAKADARAGGLTVLDGVHNDIADSGGFEIACYLARNRGFDGKTLIHPNQIEPANRIFRPDESEVANAQAIVAAFALPENTTKGVIALNGKMVERLHLAQAQTLLERFTF